MAADDQIYDSEMARIEQIAAAMAAGHADNPTYQAALKNHVRNAKNNCAKSHGKPEHSQDDPSDARGLR